MTCQQQWVRNQSFYSRLFALSINARNFCPLWDGEVDNVRGDVDLRVPMAYERKTRASERNKWDGKWGQGRA